MAELPICVILGQIVTYLKFFLTYLGIFIFIHIFPVYVNSITGGFLILAHKMLLLKGDGKPAHIPSSLNIFGGGSGKPLNKTLCIETRGIQNIFDGEILIFG